MSVTALAAAAPCRAVPLEPPDPARGRIGISRGLLPSLRRLPPRDASTFPSLAKSCAALRPPRLGRAVHARGILAGAAVSSDAFVRDLADGHVR
jgi:hypothetical protein